MAKRRKKAKRKTKRKTRRKPARKKKKTKKRKTTRRKTRKAKRRPTRRKAKKTKRRKTVRRKAKKKKGKKRKAPKAFMAPLKPSKQLAAVVGSRPLPRTQAVKKLWQYIKKKKLQDKKNRRQINADAKLKPIFGGKSKIDMFQMMKHLKKHLKK